MEKGVNKSMFFDEIPLNTLVTLCSEDIEEEFIYGFPIIYDDEELVLACVDIHGENDGYLWIRQDSVYRVDYGSAYEKRIECLYHLKQQSHEKIVFSKDKTSFAEDLLRWAFKKGKVVMMGFFNDSCEVSGYLKNPEDYIIEEIDIYECKPEQGMVQVDPYRANYIRIDSRRARDAEMVYRFKEEHKNE